MSTDARSIVMFGFFKTYIELYEIYEYETNLFPKFLLKSIIELKLS